MDKNKESRGQLLKAALGLTEPDVEIINLIDRSLELEERAKTLKDFAEDLNQALEEKNAAFATLSMNFVRLKEENTRLEEELDWARGEIEDMAVICNALQRQNRAVSGWNRMDTLKKEAPVDFQDFSVDLEFLTQGGNVVLGYFWGGIDGIRLFEGNYSGNHSIEENFDINAFQGWRIPKK